MKWRLRSTGEVLVERVELRSRLPEDMTGYHLNFIPNGRRLCVYLVTPVKFKYELPAASHLKGQELRYRLIYQIYPENQFKR